jgi:hypothetical protein
VFPVRYELNSYILFRRNFVFKGLSILSFEATQPELLTASLNRPKLKRNFSQESTIICVCSDLLMFSCTASNGSYFTLKCKA